MLVAPRPTVLSKFKEKWGSSLNHHLINDNADWLALCNSIYAGLG